MHRWGVVVVLLPFLVVVVTGILLQLKSELDWVQPPTQQGTGLNLPTQLSFDDILATAQTVPEAEISSWDDVDRLDVRPGKGIIKVRSQNRWELQLDWQTGELLQSSYRRNELIESLHDGSWFHENARLGIFLPAAIVVFILWLTGVYLFGLPYWIRWRKGRRKRRPQPMRPRSQGVKPLPRGPNGRVNIPQAKSLKE